MRTKLLLVAVVLLLPGCVIETFREAVEAGAGSDEAVEFDQTVTPPPRSPIADVIADALPSVVNVKVDTGTGSVSGEGSGVVIDEGTILTNFHVVECSVDVRIVFKDGEDQVRVNGRVVGGIPEKDLAVIKIDEDLPGIELGRSSHLRLGDEVIAIGFPLGLGEGPTVTKGIVSALDRTIEAGGGATGEARRLEGLLQTDAAINPGNSGGALIDRAGRLVGINTAAARAGTAENIGFAIQIDEALPIVEEILNEPPDRRAWLGVSVASIESSLAATEFGLDPDVRGAGVAQIFPDDPADEAGIEEGEVIVAIEGREIRSGEDLTSVLTDLNPDDVVEVDLVSADGARTVTVELGTRPPTICQG